MAKKIKKWIFRYKGEPDSEKASDLLLIFKNKSIEILDNNLPKMLLVSGTDEEIESVKKESEGWIVAPENSAYPIPDTKKKISSKRKQK